jgi:hypothetical protein
LPSASSFASCGSVKDPGQLADLRPMREVEFHVSYDGEDYLITEIK